MYTFFVALTTNGSYNNEGTRTEKSYYLRHTTPKKETQNNYYSKILNLKPLHKVGKSNSNICNIA